MIFLSAGKYSGLHAKNIGIMFTGFGTVFELLIMKDLKTFFEGI